MPRSARLVVADCPYHVTHRGNRKEPVFFGDASRRAYLGRLRHYARRYALEIWSYCLMSNHVHLIVVGRERSSMAKAIGNAHRTHARAVNRPRGWTGHLWAGRFNSAPMDETHLWRAVRYVESNPVRAGLVAHATDYPWSSARAHAGLGCDLILAPGRPFPGAIACWSTWLDTGADDSGYEVLRSGTSTGRPCGDRAFVQRLERQLGRRIAKTPPRIRKTTTGGSCP